MSWRSDRGIAEKTVRKCAVCGCEVKANNYRCNYHRGDMARTAYHAAYYWENREKLSKIARQRMADRRMKKKLRPLIDELNKVVDIGRMTAGW